MKNLQNLIRFLLAALCLVTISNARAAAPVIVAGTPMATGDEVWVVTLDNGLKKTVTVRGLTVGMSPADKAFRIQVAMQLNSVDAQLNGSSVTLRNATDLVHEKNGSLEVTKATTEFNATGAIIDYHGTLSGRRGSFILQHSGTMARGAPTLAVTVVPDSGTDELTGLSGTMVIDVTRRQHAYDFEYTLPAAP